MPLNIPVVDGVYTAVLAGEDLGAAVIGQRIKMLWGPDGASFGITVASPLPVVQTGPFVVTTLPPLAAGTAVIGAVTQSGNWFSRLMDGAGTLITSTGAALDVNVKTSAVGSQVGTEAGAIAAGLTNVAYVQSMPYSWTGSDYTRGGATPYQSDDLDESAEQIKATAGILYGYYWYNRHATAERWLKFYNHASPTVGGGGATPTLFKIGMKPNTEAHIWLGPPGIGGFSTAMSVAATTGFADSDTGAPGLNEVIFTAWRK